MLRNRPNLSRGKLERTRMRMNKHAEDALVPGYEGSIEKLHLPAAVMKAAHWHRVTLKNPAKTVDAYLAMLERAGLVQTVCVLRDHTIGE